MTHFKIENTQQQFSYLDKFQMQLWLSEVITCTYPMKILAVIQLDITVIHKMDYKLA